MAEQVVYPRESSRFLTRMLIMRVPTGIPGDLFAAVI